MTTKTGDRTKAQIMADTNIDLVQWNKNLNFHALKAIKTANDFVPTVSGDWTSSPTTVDAALNEVGADTTDLITLSGVAANAVNLGTFSGSTIADNQTIKAALQALETALELKATDNAVVHLAGTETISGTKNFTAQPHMDNAVGVKFSELDANGANYVELKPADSLAADVVVRLPSAAGTLALTTDIGADVRATATVALTSAEILGMYATPKQLVAAPAAGQAIIVENIEVLHTYSTAQYTGGGACKVQYKSTANGGGVVLGPDLDSIVKAASTSNKMWSVTNTAVDMADVTAQGLYLSVDTGTYADGNAGNVLKLRISYRVVTVVA